VLHGRIPDSLVHPGGVHLHPDGHRLELLGARVRPDLPRRGHLPAAGLVHDLLRDPGYRHQVDTEPRWDWPSVPDDRGDVLRQPRDDRPVQEDAEAQRAAADPSGSLRFLGSGHLRKEILCMRRIGTTAIII
jgi:hypothetical protein